MMINQILTIAGMEFRFGIRRGWPIVGTMVVMVVIGGGSLYLTGMNLQGLNEFVLVLVENGLRMALPPLNILVLAVVTMVCSPAIPLDRQSGMHELLFSLPLTTGRYLIGKIFGTVVIVLASFGVLSGLFILLNLVLFGHFYWVLYRDAFFISVFPVLIWATVLGVLAGAGMKNRFSATAIGLLAGLAGLLPWGWLASPVQSAVKMMSISTAWVSRILIHPVNVDILWHWYSWKDPFWPALEPSIYLKTVLYAYLLLLFLGVLTWVWMIKEENH
jgi:hypothetical protein